MEVSDECDRARRDRGPLPGRPVEGAIDAGGDRVSGEWPGAPVGGSLQLGCRSAAPLGGQNLGPSPTAYLLGALAGCAVAFLNDTLAAQFEVDIADVTAVARCSTDLRGLLAIDDIAPDLADLALEIKVSSPSPEDRVEAMLAAWRERCPIYLALVKPQSVTLTIADRAAAG